MDARTPHYLRFARTLALATTLALPACSDADDSTPTDDPADQTNTSTAGSGTGPAATATAAPTSTATMAPTDTSAVAPEDAGTRSDASPGFSSGPLPPLDMPDSMA